MKLKLPKIAKSHIAALFPLDAETRAEIQKLKKEISRTYKLAVLKQKEAKLKEKLSKIAKVRQAIKGE